MKFSAITVNKAIISVQQRFVISMNALFNTNMPIWGSTKGKVASFVFQ